jgi:beta-lactamase class A
MERLRQQQGKARRLKQWIQVHDVFVRRTSYGCIVFVTLILLFQLLYPSGKILPFVRAGGQSVGGKSITSAQKQIDGQFKHASVTVDMQSHKVTSSLSEAGIDIESATTAKAAAHYPLVQRIIPFSSLFIMTTRNEPLQVSYDDDRLVYFAKQASKSGYVAAVNATITIKNDKVELVPAKPSHSYDYKNIIDALRSTSLTDKSEVKIKPITKAAARSDDGVKQLLKDAQRAVDTPLVLKIDNDKNIVPKDTIASWLDFPEDPKTMKLTLSVKPDEVKKYLNTIQKKVYKAPGITKIHVLDGKEIGRETGAPGQGIDMAKTTSLIGDILRDGKDATVSIPVVQLAAAESYDRQYSHTSEGLAVMLQDIAGSKGYGVSVASGSGDLAGSSNGSKQFEAASTYKLYVAYSVFKQMQAGFMHWTDQINGKSAEQCFDDMIVKSDNPCAKAFAEKIGWQTVQNHMNELGLQNTRLNGQPLLTSANDLTLYLRKLNDGSLLPAGDQTRLIDAMKRQIYRSGIPAGSGGASVADKVGFLDNVTHDAGIVYSAKGPYVITIMTGSGSGWKSIADITAQINTFMTR